MRSPSLTSSCRWYPQIRPHVGKFGRNASTSPTETSPVSTTNSKSQGGWWNESKDILFQKWDEHSGQRELDHLKRSVQQASTKFDITVSTVASCRVAVEEAQRAHDESQKQLGNLLMRRDQWDGTDAASFVDYTSREVKTRDALGKARNELRKAEDDSSRCQREYMDVMRQRYHEEQMWQEKWRMLGTFGTWTLIGLNSIVFLGSQIFHQRREENRMKAMEELIKDNMQAMKDTVTVRRSDTVGEALETHSESMPTTAKPEETNSEVMSTIAKHEETEAMPTTAKHEETTAVIEARQDTPTSDSWRTLIRENDYKRINTKIGATAQEIVNNLHGPSVAFGAGACAMVFLGTLLFTSKR